MIESTAPEQDFGCRFLNIALLRKKCVAVYSEPVKGNAASGGGSIFGKNQFASVLDLRKTLVQKVNYTNNQLFFYAIIQTLLGHL